MSDEVQRFYIFSTLNQQCKWCQEDEAGTMISGFWDSLHVHGCLNQISNELADDADLQIEINVPYAFGGTMMITTKDQFQVALTHYSKYRIEIMNEYKITITAMSRRIYWMRLPGGDLRLGPYFHKTVNECLVEILENTGDTPYRIDIQLPTSLGGFMVVDSDETMVIAKLTYE
jgi:hypothetical protein